METACDAFLSQVQQQQQKHAMKMLQNRLRKQQQKEIVKVGPE
jgi:hypothetical protein